MYLKQLQYLLIRTRAAQNLTDYREKLDDLARTLNDLIEQLIEHETNGK